jgi:putative DNA primase/helicase
MTAADKILDQVLNQLGQSDTFEQTIAFALAGIAVHNLRYDLDHKGWFNWTGNIWAGGKLAQVAVDTMVKVFLGKIVERRRDTMKIGQKRQMLSAKMMASIEKIMRTDARLAVTRDHWNRDPYLVAAPNGVVDLRTGKLKAGVATDMITRVTRWPIDPKGTKAKLWLEFLDKITRGDKKLQKFLQLWFGISLVAEVVYQRLVFIYGLGANGKNTLVDTIARLVGDYCVRVDIDTFLQQRSAQHPAGLARAISAPMAFAVEAPDNTTFDMAKLKMVTGEDEISARFMHQNFATSRVQCSLTITGNYMPNLRDVDPGIVRRFLMVHLDYMIPESERVPRYHDVLVNAEGPAIMRWIIDGAVECLNGAGGLVIPPAVAAATAEYFEEQDVMKQFVDDCCEVDNRPAGEQKQAPWVVDAGALLMAWKSYASEVGRPATPAGFKTRLLRAAPGVKWFADNKGKHYSGIRLKNEFSE